jgi:hypothetical protein
MSRALKRRQKSLETRITFLCSCVIEQARELSRLGHRSLGMQAAVTQWLLMCEISSQRKGAKIDHNVYSSVQPLHKYEH